MTRLFSDSKVYRNLVNVPLVQEVQALLDATRDTPRASEGRQEASRRLRVGALAHSLAAEAARQEILQGVAGELTRAEDLSTAAGQLFLRSARLAEQDSGTLENAVRDRLESAVEFLAGGRFAITAAVARPAAEWLSRVQLPSSSDEQIALNVLRVLAQALVGGGMPSLESFSHFRIEALHSATPKPTTTKTPALVLEKLVRLMHTFSEGLRSGDLSAARSVAGSMTDVAADLESLVNGEISDLFLRFAGIVGFLTDHSVWNVAPKLNLSTLPVGKELTSHLLSQRRVFLFPAQLSALQIPNMLDTQRSHIISMPTGSGKTLLAVFILLRHVVQSTSQLGTHQPRVFYLVPSRALAKEKVEELRSLFRHLPAASAKVCQLTGDLILNAKEAILGYDVIVATPEKFDMLLRVPELRPAVGAVLVDEFHNIRTDGRGLRLLVSLARLRNHAETAKVPLHLISAVVRPEDLFKVRNWLDRFGVSDAYRAVDFQSREPPLFIRTGVFDFKAERTSHSWTIRYDDGSSKALKPPSGKEKPLSVRQARRAAEHIALALVDEGPVLLFATAAQWRWNSDWQQWATMPLIQAVDVASQVQSLPSWIDNNAYDNFVRQLSKLLGSGHRMVEAAKRGVSAHWGGLPVRARRLVEAAVSSRAVAVLIATSTLAEGVNLPFKRVIISKCDIGGQPFDVGFFLNLKGRVGRPFLTEEGEVVLIRSQTSEDAQIGELQRATADDVEPLCSPLVKIPQLRKLFSEPEAAKSEGAKKSRVQFDDLVESLDTVVLAVIAENHILMEQVREQLRPFLSLAPEEIDDSALTEMDAAVSRLMDWKLIETVDRSLTPTDFGRRVYESGFPPGSAVFARNSLTRIDLDKILLVPSTPSSGESWNFLVTICTILSRTRAWSNVSKLGIRSPEQAAIFAKDWVQGKLLREIARDRKADRLYVYSLLEGGLAPLLAWFIFALSLWISDHRAFPGVSPEVVRRLQAWSEFLWFGAPPSRALALLKYDFVGRLFRDDVLILERHGGSALWDLLDLPQEAKTDQLLLQKLQDLQEDTLDSADYLLKVLRDLSSR